VNFRTAVARALGKTIYEILPRLHVLEGAKQTLIDNRPVVLIEIKETNRASVFRFFSALNYVEQRLDQRIGTNQSPENHLFVPR
jgi:hypothetical protein